MADSIVRHAVPVQVYEDIPAAHDFLVWFFGFGAGGIDRDSSGRPMHPEVHAGDTVV